MPCSAKVDHLCVAAPKLASEIVVPAANKRYLAGWRQLEQVLRIPENQCLSSLLRHFPHSTRHLIMMSPSFRSLVDKLSILLEDGFSVEEARAVYETEAMPFVTAVARANLLALQGSALQEVGFDLLDRITDPLPFAVSVWRQSVTPAGGEWCESRDVERLFSQHMSDVSGAQRCTLRDVPSDKADMFLAAQTVLAEISPMAARDVALNVRYVAYIDYQSWTDLEDDEYREIGQSISSHLVPSCCFFSGHSFISIDRLVEGLFHEALHKKLSNTLVAFPLLNSTFASSTSKRFFSYWNVDTPWNSNLWEFDRALYAYHVYVHLAVLYDDLALIPHKHFPESIVRIQLGRCIERATALGNWILTEGRSSLTDDGMGFVKMLSQHMPVRT